MNELDRFKQTCHQFLVIDDTTYIDIVFGAIFANRLDSTPVWLYLVDRPSSGKTEILTPLYQSPEIYWTDTLTTNTLISFYKGKTDPARAPKLNNKVLVIKDFTGMLTMRRESLHEILGQLRNLYDGRISKTSGTGVTKTYDVKCGIIAAVTDEIDSHRALLTALGERFLTYRISNITPYEESKRCMKAMKVVSVAKQAKAMTSAAHQVLSQSPPPASISDASLREIVKIGQIAARGRTSVHRDRYTREPDIVRPEYAVRLCKQLSDLAIGIAMARDKRSVTKEEVLLVQHAAIHSLDLKRKAILDIMIHNPSSWIGSSDIATPLCLTNETARYHLDDLTLLDLAQRRTIIGKKGVNVFQWKLKQVSILQRIFRIPQ